MNRRDLNRAVAAHTGRDVKDVEEILSAFTEVVTGVVAQGEPVVITGFAKFTKNHRPARMARNPATGAPVRVPAKTVAKATAMKSFKDAVMSPRQAPRLARGVWPTDPELLARQAQVRKGDGAARPSATTTARSTAGPRKATAKKATTKKAAATKATTKKAATKKATTKKAAARTTTKRAPATKAASKRPVAKKTAAKKVVAKKTVAKKTVAKKTVAKKTATKRAPAKRSAR